MPAELLPTLRRLDEGVPQALADRDFWYLVTAAGLVLESHEDAVEAINLATELLGCPFDDQRVLDAGCGIGRHLRILQDRGARAVGIDTAASLAAIAEAEGLPALCMTVDDALRIGPFDIVTAFAHSLFGDGDGLMHLRRLRAVRSVLRDHGVALLELMPQPDDSTVQWRADDTLSASEVVVVDPSDGCGVARAHRRFRFEFNGQRECFDATSVHYDVSALAALADGAGLRVESSAELPSGNLLVALRAEKGFNYLSDLTEFLAAWADADHPRNAYDGQVVLDGDGRRRPEHTTAVGSGLTLTRHHPGFDAAVEERISPLVRVLVFGWDQITYSSCGGHLIGQPGREVFTEAYVGLVVLSPDRAGTLTRLLTRCADGAALDALRPAVRGGVLLGPTGAVDVVDLCLRRTSSAVDWASYRAAVEESVAAVTSRLGAVASQVRRRQP